MALSRENVTELYVALFNRAPEGEAVDNWLKAANENNWSMSELAESMLNAAKEIVASNEEYKNIYPHLADFNEHDEHDVRELITKSYEILFNKSYEDDPEGIDNWTKLAVKDGMPVGNIIANIIYVAKQIANGSIKADEKTVTAAKAFENKIKAADYVSEKFKKFDGDFNKFKTFVQIVDNSPNKLDQVIELANLEALKELNKKIEDIAKRKEDLNFNEDNDLYKHLEENHELKKEILELAVKESGVNLDIEKLLNLNLSLINTGNTENGGNSADVNMNINIPLNIKSILEDFKTHDKLVFKHIFEDREHSKEKNSEEENNRDDTDHVNSQTDDTSVIEGKVDDNNENHSNGGILDTEPTTSMEGVNTTHGQVTTQGGGNMQPGGVTHNSGQSESSNTTGHNFVFVEEKGHTEVYEEGYEGDYQIEDHQNVDLNEVTQLLVNTLGDFDI